ncbi:MAG TPA: hypothetical protein VF791_05550 [Pyrinomonadaceae bacterium]
MSNRDLPVLNFESFRKYPTKHNEQEFSDESQVCHGCLSGVCCSNQDPIALNSFDIFRLSAFFNMSPAEFMLNFTQDAFDHEDSEWRRRSWYKDPNSSIVTWLRRRENLAASPCIFLKYIREPDGTPHRICSIHDARPLSCREFYFTHCKTRGTGELAALLAEGFEKVRDGEITEAMVDKELLRFGNHDFQTATLAESMEYSFWVEMKCAINMDRANVEGANSYNMADYQDPIDEKLNRVVSSKHLRGEEHYGPRPINEQLMPYTSGLSFAGSPEYQRIMMIRRTPPSSNLFALGNYPYWIGIRTMVNGVRHSDLFPAIPDKEIKLFLDSIPPASLFPHHELPEVRGTTQRDIYASVLKGYNYLIRFASHIASIDNILEFDPPGTLETELFEMIVGFETSLNPYVAHNPYFQPIKQHMAKMTINSLEEELAAATSPEEIFNCLRTVCDTQLATTPLPSDLRMRADALIYNVNCKLQKDSLDLYVRPGNSIEARRAAGKRLNAEGAWWEWYHQLRDMRYAAIAGFSSIDLSTYYRQSMDRLEKLSFRKSYAIYLYHIVMSFARSMSSNNRLAYQDMPYKDVADRLAEYGIRLFNWMRGTKYEHLDLDIAATFPAVLYKGLGLSYDHDPNFGRIVRQLLDSQLPDGSWGTNHRPDDMPDSQKEYLTSLYSTTWACIDALRPMRNDVWNNKNAALGLV